MTRLIHFLIVLAVFAATAPQPTAASEPLRPGDILIVQIPGETAFVEPIQVDREGRALLPEVGHVAVGGLSPDKAGVVIRKALAKVYRDLDRLVVYVKERRLAISVLGFVKDPGPVDLADGATVQMALNAAGGLAQGAQLDRIQVRRQGDVITFDYKRYLDTGDKSLIPRLQSLDEIFVPASPLTGNVQVEFDANTLTAAGDAAEDGKAVTVFGEVHRPGTFSFKSGNTVIDLLMRAGGVTRYAGVDQIRVISNGNPVPFNMREYLDTGERRLLPKLGPGDIVFVPQASENIETGARTVYVMGEVFRPGAYETREGTGFLEIMATAGGPTRFADTRQIRILRTDGSVDPFDLQAHTEGTENSALPRVAAGDAILVPEKTDMNEKSWLKISPDRAVRIIGAVHRPGRYEWAAEMSLMDLVAHAGGPRAEADTAHVQILADDGNDRVGSRTFNLKEFLEHGGEFSSLPAIGAGDTVVVPELPKDPNDSRSQWVRQPKEHSIYVFGEVGAPGRYAFNEGLAFLDILAAAQGPTAQADLRSVRITHRGGSDARVTHFDLSLYFRTGDETLLPRVLPEDVIHVPGRNPAWLEKSKENTVRVLGAVGQPGRFAFDDSMTILDLLAEAGGPSDSALQDKIVVVNRSVDGPKAHIFDLVAFARQGDFTRLPVLRAGDTVYVPNIQQSNWRIFSEALRDAVSVLSLVRLAAGM